MIIRKFSIIYIAILGFLLTSCAIGGVVEEEEFLGNGEKENTERDSSIVAEVDEAVETPDEDFSQTLEEEPDEIETVDEYQNVDEEPQSSIFPDVSGVYAQKMDLYADAKTAIGSTEGLTETYMLVTHTQEGEKLAITSEICKIDVTNSLINIVIPDKFVNSLPIIDKIATLSIGDNGEILFSQPKFWEIRSVRLGDPETSLPEDGDDERVEDWDEDLRQGLTMKISGGGWISIIQKSWTILEGVVESDGNLKGLVDWGETQVILEASNSLLKLGSQNFQHKDKSKSNWKNIKVDNDFTCEDFRSQIDTLFE